MPARGRLGRWRDRAAASLLMRVFRTGMPALNQARAEYGLAPLRDLGDVLDAVGRVLVCTSPSYDFAAGDVPGNVRYVGPQLDDEAAEPTGPTKPTRRRDMGRSGRSPARPGRPEQHRDEPRGGVAAAGGRRARPAPGPRAGNHRPGGGPGGDPRSGQRVVRRWVRHADVLPYCSAVLTHGGHGTVIKALAAGVPLVVAPLGRDQPDNAARVVRAGAGLRVSRKASAADLRKALGRVLEEPRFRTAARRMAATLAAERDEGLVVDELERTALEGTAAVTSGPPRSVMAVKEEKDMTRIAVAGATGRVGRHVVDVLRGGGHDVVPISRSNGVDVITGDGLARR